MGEYKSAGGHAPASHCTEPSWLFMGLEAARASPVNSFSGVLQYKTNTHTHSLSLSLTHTHTHTHDGTGGEGGTGGRGCFGKMGPRKNRTYGQTNATFRQYSVWGVQNRSQMAPQRTTTLDFIDSEPHPPQWPPRQPRTAPRGLEAAQRPRLASANAQPPP